MLAYIHRIECLPWLIRVLSLLIIADEIEVHLCFLLLFLGEEGIFGQLVLRVHHDLFVDKHIVQFLSDAAGFIREGKGNGKQVVNGGVRGGMLFG